MVFVGCSDGGGSKKEGDKTLPDLVFEGDEITVVKIGNPAWYDVGVASGNTFSIDTTTGTTAVGATDALGAFGFGYKFPAEAADYDFVILEAELVEVGEDSCVAFTIKKSNEMGDLAGFGANSSPQYSRNAELNIGDTVGEKATTAEMKGDTLVTSQFRKSLFGDGIYFQFNGYAEYWKPKTPPTEWESPTKHAKLRGHQSFKLKVTKVTFTNGGTPADMDLTADHFAVGNSKQYLSDGAVTAVTVTPVGGIFDADKITAIYYGADDSDDVATATTTIPQSVGVYKVYIDVAKAEGYKAATKLEVGTLTIEATPPPYLFSLAEWTAENSTIGYGSRPLQANAGDPTYAVTAGKITVTGLGSTNDGIDLWIGATENGLDLNPAVNEYVVVLKGKSLSAPASAAKILIQGASNPYNWVANGDITAADQSFDLTASIPKTYFTAHANANGYRLRIVCGTATFNFEITEFTIENVGEWDD